MVYKTICRCDLVQVLILTFLRGVDTPNFSPPVLCPSCMALQVGSHAICCAHNFCSLLLYGQVSTCIIKVLAH